MDDLYIKMIANTKKIKASKGQGSAFDAENVSRLVKILERDVLAYECVVENYDDFVNFFARAMPTLVVSFEKTLVGKNV